MSPDESATAREPADLLIWFFATLAFGAWIVFSATDVTTEVWAWLVVAGVAMIAAVVTGAVAGTKT